jgi:hypothetical protein
VILLPHASLPQLQEIDRKVQPNVLNPYLFIRTPIGAGPYNQADAQTSLRKFYRMVRTIIEVRSQTRITELNTLEAVTSMATDVHHQPATVLHMGYFCGDVLHGEGCCLRDMHNEAI